MLIHRVSFEHTWIRFRLFVVMLKRLQSILGLFSRTLEKWNADHMQQFAAALAYFALFSIAPLLIIVTAIAGAVLGQDAARAQVIAQLQDWIGAEGATLITGIIDNISKPGAGVIATIFGVVTLLLGAAGLFGQVKLTMLIIWEVKPPIAPNTFRAILNSIREQALAVVMVLATGVVLLGSLVITTIFSTFNNAVTSEISRANANLAIVGELANIVISVALLTIIFGAIFRYVPGISIHWRDTLPAGLVTAALFVIGRALIGLYLARTTVSSTYGTAGALVVVLLWIYYSAMIFFFGAVFSQVYTYRFGSRRDRPEPAVTDLVSKASGDEQSTATAT